MRGLHPQTQTSHTFSTRADVLRLLGTGWRVRESDLPTSLRVSKSPIRKEEYATTAFRGGSRSKFDPTEMKSVTRKSSGGRGKGATAKAAPAAKPRPRVPKPKEPEDLDDDFEEEFGLPKS